MNEKEEKIMNETELKEEEKKAVLRIQYTINKLLEFDNSEEFKEVLVEYKLALFNLYITQFKQALLPVGNSLDGLMERQEQWNKDLNAKLKDLNAKLKKSGLSLF